MISHHHNVTHREKSEKSLKTYVKVVSSKKRRAFFSVHPSVVVLIYALSTFNAVVKTCATQ